MFSYLYCECQICDRCIAQSVTVTVKEKNIRDLVCPMCQKPDVLDEETSIPHFQHIEHKVINNLSLLLGCQKYVLLPDAKRLFSRSERIRIERYDFLQFVEFSNAQNSEKQLLCHAMKLSI